MDIKNDREPLSEERRNEGFEAFKKAYEASDNQRRAGMAKLVAGCILGHFYTDAESVNTELRDVRANLKVEENENTDKLTPDQIAGNKSRADDLRAKEAGLILNRLALEFGQGNS